MGCKSSFRHHEHHRQAEPGIDVLKPAEYIAGWRILEQKVDKYRQEVLAIVGSTARSCR